MTTIRKIPAIYENGSLRLLESVDLEEGQELLVQIAVEESKPQITKRIYDMHAGTYWMSDDFDDELPDSFWLGEEG